LLGFKKKIEFFLLNFSHAGSVCRGFLWLGLASIPPWSVADLGGYFRQQRNPQIKTLQNLLWRPLLYIFWAKTTPAPQASWSFGGLFFSFSFFFFVPFRFSPTYSKPQADWNLPHCIVPSGQSASKNSSGGAAPACGSKAQHRAWPSFFHISRSNQNPSKP